MSKSLVVAYIGGRGSGKTLSMTAEMAIAMVLGKKVWSNYPISFDYIDSDGKIQAFHSETIDMSDILNMQDRPDIKNGFIALDEWNLWLNSRRSASMGNQIFSGVVQLIRKRRLSFYLSCQRFATLDINMRWQTDVLVHCFDLSFHYRNLPEGAVISQQVTDWSGVLCGRPLWNSRFGDPEWERNTRTRMLKKAKLFWNCYDSFEEFDVMDIMSTRYQLGQRQKQVIGKLNDNGGFAKQKLSDYRDLLIYSGKKQVPVDQVKNDLKEYGFDGEFRGELGKMLKAAGFIFRQSRRGAFYEISEDSQL